VTSRGDKEFLAIEDGYRESEQSWTEVLLSLKDRGFRSPKLGVNVVNITVHEVCERGCHKASIAKKWGERRGLNPRPLGPQPRALPAELRPPYILLS
jgi:hypothetical protein